MLSPCLRHSAGLKSAHPHGLLYHSRSRTVPRSNVGKACQRFAANLSNEISLKFHLMLEFFSMGTDSETAENNDRKRSKVFVREQYGRKKLPSRAAERYFKPDNVGNFLRRYLELSCHLVDDETNL